MRLPHLIRLHRHSHVHSQPPAQPAPVPPAVDRFTPTSIASPVLPQRDDVAAVAASSAITGGVKSPYAMGRIHADGRQMVGENGQAFTWRGVSEFMLPYYLNDKSHAPEENEATV